MLCVKLNYILSRTVYEIWRISGQIFGMGGQGVPLFNAFVYGLKPYF